MEVILRQDVDKVGLRGEVVNVARGYARNFLLPRGLADEATPARVAELQKVEEHRARHEAAMGERPRAETHRHLRHDGQHLAVQRLELGILDEKIKLLLAARPRDFRLAEADPVMRHRIVEDRLDDRLQECQRNGSGEKLEDQDAQDQQGGDHGRDRKLRDEL